LILATNVTNCRESASFETAPGGPALRVLEKQTESPK
jgi:hypothetical protein